MTAITHLLNRNGTYYCRVKVPKQYQSQLGKTEIWKSLGRISYTEASKQVKLAAYNIFSNMGVMDRKIRELRSEDIPVIAENYYHVLLENDENSRTGQRKAARVALKGEPDFYLQGIEELKASISEDLTLGNYDGYTTLADRQLEVAYLSSNAASRHSNNVYKRLCMALMQEAVRAYEVIIARESGDWTAGSSAGKVKTLYDMPCGTGLHNPGFFFIRPLLIISPLYCPLSHSILCLSII